MIKKKKSKKGGGGKRVRSEMVQTRLSPPLRLMGEMMARQQPLTLSSFIEKLMEEAAEYHTIPAIVSEKTQTDCHVLGERQYKKISIKETAHLGH